MAFALTIYEIVLKVKKEGNIIINKTHIAVKLFFVFLPLIHLSLSQETKKPLVYRNYETTSIPLVLPSTLDMQLLEAFVLMKKANAGESPAQHELGLRYLFGKGFPADTVKAASWILKAAKQKLAIAQYNYGILLMNGRGVEWNPFEAFKIFRMSAEQLNPDALYVVGLFYTENLVVQRDWQKAYQYFKKSAEYGNEYAPLAIKEIESRLLHKEPDKLQKEVSKKSARKDSIPTLLFIDFHADTTSTVDDTTIIRDVYKGIDTASIPNLTDSNNLTKVDTSVFSSIMMAASAGSPEALCFIGRCYERGIYLPKNIILAALFYIRALNLDSFRAPALLWKLINQNDFTRELEFQTTLKNPDALFVWSGLTYSGFSKRLSGEQAFELLQQTAKENHIQSLIDLGSCYYTGRWVKQDRNKAIEIWKHASNLGSYEATIRYAAAIILTRTSDAHKNLEISILRKAAKDGSLLADLTLAYCYENGIVLKRKKGEAYRLYHKSLFRGSESAYNALYRMYDEIRPDDPEFLLTN